MKRKVRINFKLFCQENCKETRKRKIDEILKEKRNKP